MAASGRIDEIERVVDGLMKESMANALTIGSPFVTKDGSSSGHMLLQNWHQSAGSSILNPKHPTFLRATTDHSKEPRSWNYKKFSEMIALTLGSAKIVFCPVALMPIPIALEVSSSV